MKNLLYKHPYKAFLLVFFICLIFILLNTIPIIYAHIGGNYYRGLMGIYVKVSHCGSWGLWCSEDYEKVYGADAGSFHFIGNGIAFDNNSVFCGQRLDNADRGSFSAVDSSYSKDKNGIRWGCALQQKIGGPFKNPVHFDPDSFKPVGCGFVKDASGVYVHNLDSYDISEYNAYSKYRTRIDVMKRVDIADPETFELVPESKGKGSTCFSRDKNYEYRSNYQGNGMGAEPNIEIIHDLSNAGHVDLGCDFYRTPAGVFYHETRVENADPDSFHAFVLQDGSSCEYSHYAGDKSHVYHGYYGGVAEVPDADPATFQILPHDYAFDKDNRYKQGQKFVSDPYFDEAYNKLIQSQRSIDTSRK